MESCWPFVSGYQLLGHYYMGANGEKIKGISALDHYTLSQENNRFIGDIVIHNEEFDETYYGFEKSQWSDVSWQR